MRLNELSTALLVLTKTHHFCQVEANKSMNVFTRNFGERMIGGGNCRLLVGYPCVAAVLQRSWSTTSSRQLRSLTTTMMIQIDEKVKAALKSGRPVVALESTIVAHGMPYPENLHLSQRVATILRDKGVEPATIGTYVQ